MMTFICTTHTIFAQNDPETCTLNEKTEDQGIRDTLYYFETVIFKVENTLFRVHKEDFDVKGTVFETMFSLPPVDNGEEPEGATDARPIVLDGISKIQFHGFLRAIYPSRSDAPWTYEEMLGALHLSTMWGFSELRKSAIVRLSPFIEGNPSYDNIMLAKHSKVKEWLLDAYVTLGLIPLPALEILELYKKGIDGLTITKLFMVRESIGPRDMSGRHVNCGRCKCYKDGHSEASSKELRKQAVERVIDLFAKEFERLEV